MTADAQYHNAEPVDADWQDAPFGQNPAFNQEQNPMLGEMPHHPLHVKVVDTQTENVAAEFTAWTSYALGLIGGQVATQLCPHRYHRYKAYFNFTLFATAATTVTLYFANKPDPLSNPTAPPTVYQIQVPLAANAVTNFQMPVYEGQQPVYAAFSGANVATCNVAVMDESYGTVQ
jgi:hypothetical protein